MFKLYYVHAYKIKMYHALKLHQMTTMLHDCVPFAV